MRRLLFAAAIALVGCAPSAGDDDSTQVEEVVAGARICSWNIRRLGHKFDGRPKDMAATAAIIEDSCDVIAVQEVMQSRGAATGFEELRTTLGPGWDGVVTSRAKPSAPGLSSAERYAFFFRKAAASFCDGWTGAQLFDDARGTFLRAPAWTCFKIAGYPRDVVLGTYHAVFGSTVERRREVSALDDDLDDDGRDQDVIAEIRASRTTNPDILMVGDFNLTPRDMEIALPAWRDVTSGAGSTINSDDGVSNNLYDHLLVPPDEPNLAGLRPAEVLDVRSYAKDDTFFRSISDHLPIRFVLSP